MRHFLRNTTVALLVAAATLAPAAAYADSHSASVSGSFKGASDHVTTGGVSIIKTSNGGAVVILDTNFSLDGAPDPRVGLGKNGTFVETSDLGKLVSKEGLQVYIVPSSVNVDDFNEVYVWCKQFSVPLGVASVK